MNEDPELKQFPLKIRNYLIKRCIIIYFIVGGVSIFLGFIFNYIFSFLDPNLVPIIMPFTIAGFVIGINLFLQWWSRFYPLPKELQTLIKRAGFKIGKRKFYHFRFFRRTQIYPTEKIYLKIGLEVKYFPFLELRKGYCKINMISKKLCSPDDIICGKIVQDIAEKNLLAWENEKSSRKARVVNRMGGLRFTTSCNPDEAISRLFQMSKAIKEWESGISKISKMVTSANIF